MTIEASGLVLKQQSVGESDKLITILTAEHGIIRAFVRKAKKTNSPYASATQQLCYSDFSIYAGKDKFIVNSAAPREVFFNLHKDIEKLALAQYFCELSLAVVSQSSEARDFLRLVLNSLHMIANTDKNKFLIKAVMELKGIALAGYMPDLIACKGCGEYVPEKIYFSVQNACIYCSKCLPSYFVGARTISVGVLSAMRHILYSEFKNIFNFKLSDENVRLLSETTEAYVQEVLNRGFKTLDFLKNIL